MKTRKLTFIVAGLASVLTAPVFALDAPEDNAPPPPSLKQDPAALPEIKLRADNPPAAEAKSEAAFLGVISSELPDVLAAHLDLQAGHGIVVRSLVPDGPAAKAGLAVNDVITAVGGEAIGTPADLSASVSAHKTGETISLGFIHKGKAAQVDVTLGSRPAGLSGTDPQTGQLDFEGLPQDLADRLRAAMAGNTGGLNLHLGGDAIQMEEAMRDLQKRMQTGGLNPSDPNPTAKIQTRGSATIRMRDNEGTVEVTSENGDKQVTVRDHQDQVVWSGPWNSEADKVAAPGNVQQRVDSLNLDTNFKGGGLRFNFNHKAAGDEDH